MHFYLRHIGDYGAATVGLSILQHGALTLLLDVYYHQEKPLSFSNKELYFICRAKSKAEKSAIDSVLSRFFVLHVDGYRHAKADEYIATHVRSAAVGRIYASRKNGSLGGRPVKRAYDTQEPDGLPNVTNTRNPTGSLG